jgi:hypothetical protein
MLVSTAGHHLPVVAVCCSETFDREPLATNSMESGVKELIELCIN